MKRFLLACALAGSALAFAVHYAKATVTPITYVGNVAYQMLNSDKTIVPSVALTTNRTWTLPYAGGTNLTGNLDIIDAQGNIGGANSCLVIAPQSGDTINGSSNSITFCGTYGKFSIFPISGTNWTYSVVAAGQNAGTTTNDNASTGNVGEMQTVVVTKTNARQATTNSSTTLGSVSLTAGDWDCNAVMSQALSPTTTATQLSASIVGTDGVLGTQGTDGTTTIVPASAISVAGDDLRMGQVRESLASTTTIFLVSGATFATSQLWTYGSLRCRRMR
jgi:hypothetical protein